MHPGLPNPKIRGMGHSPAHRSLDLVCAVAAVIAVCFAASTKLHDVTNMERGEGTLLRQSLSSWRPHAFLDAKCFTPAMRMRR